MQYLHILHGLLTAALAFLAFLRYPYAVRTGSSPAYIDSIILFGDSITESFAAGSLSQRMAERYTRVLDVVNRGFSGYNSRQYVPLLTLTDNRAIPVLQEFLSTAKHPGQPVRLMTIWFGTNDAVVPGHKQHVPLDEYKANLATIVHLIRSPDSAYYSPDTKLIMLTPGPMIDKGNPNRSVERPKVYANACKEVADELGVSIVDVYEAIVEAAGGETKEKLAPFLYDGLHYTPRAYEAVFDALVTVIDREYPDLGSEVLLALRNARVGLPAIPLDISWDPALTSRGGDGSCGPGVTVHSTSSHAHCSVQTFTRLFNLPLKPFSSVQPSQLPSSYPLSYPLKFLKTTDGRAIRAAGRG